MTLPRRSLSAGSSSRCMTEDSTPPTGPFPHNSRPAPGPRAIVSKTPTMSQIRTRRMAPVELIPPQSLGAHLKAIESIYDRYAQEIVDWQRRNRGYHRALEQIGRHYIAEGERVLEVGCGAGDLLAALN